jgi:hypothetical protein
MSVAMKTCKQCGLAKPTDEFRIKTPTVRRGATPKVYRAQICKVCEVTNHDRARELDPYRPAFAQRRRDHASRYGHTVKDLERMGWDTERRSIEMRAQYENGFCPNCIETAEHGVKVHFFRDMSHGLADLTIDRINPDLPPIWPGNIQWLCGTCNKRKRDRNAVLHGQRIQQEHELRCQEQATPPQGRLW